MYGSAPDYPDPPDPRETASAQTGMNVDTALVSNLIKNMAETTPEGQVRYKNTGTQDVNLSDGSTYGIPTWEKVTRLSPEQQRIYNAETGAKGNMAETAELSSGFLKGYLPDTMKADGLPDWSSLPTGSTSNIRTSVGFTPEYAQTYGGEGSYDKVRDQYTDALLTRARPELEKSRAAMETDLVNRGVNIGSEAYGDAHGTFGQQENDMTLAAILAGGDEAARMEGLARDKALFGNNVQSQMLQDRMAKAGFTNTALGQKFGQQLGAAQFGDNQRGQAVAEKFAFRNQPINEITALLSGSQVAMPQFATPGQSPVANTDYAGLVANIYGQESQNAGNEYAASGSLWGNLLGAGGKIGAAALA